MPALQNHTLFWLLPPEFPLSFILITELVPRSVQTAYVNTLKVHWHGLLMYLSLLFFLPRSSGMCYLCVGSRSFLDREIAEVVGGEHCQVTS